EQARGAGADLYRRSLAAERRTRADLRRRDPELAERVAEPEPAALERERALDLRDARAARAGDDVRERRARSGADQRRQRDRPRVVRPGRAGIDAVDQQPAGELDREVER